jgi:hypothetical protein
MAYGILKCDNITFDNGGSDQNVTVSGLYRATTSGVTVSGTIAATTVSGVTVIGSTTVSGATVTGTTANFTSGNFSNIISSAATMSGALIMANQQQVRFREAVGNGVNHIALQAPAIVSADQTITLPDQTGTVITTGDNGSVSSTMLATNLTISAAAGSATTPSIAFTGDLNTGIYSPGADQLAVSTGGTGRLFVDASGNVGIGTSSPGYALDVAAADTTASTGYAVRIRANATAGAGSLQFTDSAATLQYGLLVFGANGVGTLQADGASSRLVFGTNATERLRIDSSGRVGIGTSALAAKLTAYGDGTSADTLDVINPSASNGATIRFADTNNSSAIKTIPAAGTHSLGFFVNTSSTERLRIDSSGRVGIGTSSPSSGLHLANATAGSAANFTLSNPANNWSIRTGTTENALVFVDNQFSSEKARIDSSGRVGIGTSSPAAKTEIVTTTNGDGLRLSYDNTPIGGHGATLVFTNKNNASTLFPIASVKGIITNGAVGGEGGGLTFNTATGGAAVTERMRIGSDGLITAGSGDVNGMQALLLNSGQINASVGLLSLRTVNNNSGGYYQAFRNAADTIIGTISQNGTTGVAYNTSSDYRLKENVVDLDGAIDRLNQLPVHRFNFIADPDTVVDGFIAHEAAAVVPECVTGTKDEVDEDDNPIYQGIDQSKLVPLLTAALQEAIARIETLEAAVAALLSA